MATNIAPHNLTECINGIIAYIDNPYRYQRPYAYVKAPDFPTGGYIYGYEGKEAFETGRGRIVIRGKAEIETDKTHDQIIITEIPYMVNKADLIKHIADLVTDKKIEGISNINDESDRQGMRIVIDIKRDANANVVLNKLYKLTALQSSFNVNNIALVKGRPQMLNLKDMIEQFVEHRHEVVIRRTKFDLNKAEERAHILEGLIVASDNIDEVIAIIRSSSNPKEAMERLMNRFQLSEVQSRAIVEMRLRQLTGLEQDKLRTEYGEIKKQIEYFKEILNNDDLCMQVIKDELIEIRDKYGDERRSEIIYASEELNPEDFYADDEMIITISHMGYIKRTPLSEFRTQNRGGVGSKGSETRDEDFVEFIYPATNHNYMLFFTQKGKCYWLRVYEIPEGSRTSKGRAIQNLLNIDPDDAVTALSVCLHWMMKRISIRIISFSALKMDSEKHCWKLIPSTSKRCKCHYSKRRRSVISVRLTDGNKACHIGKQKWARHSINESDVRPMGRTATGVKGMTLDEGENYVIGMICMDPDSKTQYWLFRNKDTENEHT